MMRFNTAVLTLAVGAVIGTVTRPGVLEVAVVAAVVCVAAALFRQRSARRVTSGALGVHA